MSRCKWMCFKLQTPQSFFFLDMCVNRLRLHYKYINIYDQCPKCWSHIVPLWNVWNKNEKSLFSLFSSLWEPILSYISEYEWKKKVKSQLFLSHYPISIPPNSRTHAFTIIVPWRQTGRHREPEQERLARVLVRVLVRGRRPWGRRPWGPSWVPFQLIVELLCSWSTDNSRFGWQHKECSTEWSGLGARNHRLGVYIWGYFSSWPPSTPSLCEDWIADGRGVCVCGGVLSKHGIWSLELRVFIYAI